MIQRRKRNEGSDLHRGGLTTYTSESPDIFPSYGYGHVPDSAVSFGNTQEDRVDSFELCNAFRPLLLLIENLTDDAAGVGLTEKRLRVPVERRSRSAQLYAETPFESKRACLYFRVVVIRSAFRIREDYIRGMIDPVSSETSGATTWMKEIFGTHGNDFRFSVQIVTEKWNSFCWSISGSTSKNTVRGTDRRRFDLGRYLMPSRHRYSVPLDRLAGSARPRR